MENKHKKVAFIIPYLGKLPNYFQIFLDSCSYNKSFDWLIFSDDVTSFDYPSNVHFYQMTFEQCKKLIQSKFNFEISLSVPQKLCDYKCAYGDIFADFIKEYRWWGHCDTDQIFGNLENFITDEMLEKYEKIGSLGHLTLYRNTPENNKTYASTDRYRQVFTIERGCAFDEWLPGNINEIYLASHKNIMLENYGADINPYMTTFQTVHYDLARNMYCKSEIKNSVFCFDNGNLKQIYIANGKLEEKEYPYVHLQKRAMKDLRSQSRSARYCIVPNKFVDFSEYFEKLLKTTFIRSLINTQFFKVKYKSLKYRINNQDWKFTNILKDKGD